MSVLQRLVAGALLGATAMLAQAGHVDDQATISKSDKLTLDASDYRAHLMGRGKDELGFLAQSDKNLMDRALDFHSDSVLMREAEAAGLDKDPAIATRLADARRKILSGAYMAKVAQDVQFGDLESLARERYALRKEVLVTPERRKVAHILLTDSPGCRCDKRPPALERAKALEEQLKAGADFAELAKAESSDAATAANGGLIPTWIEENGLTAKPFEHATFRLNKVGDISSPIKTDFGIHLIKLVDVEVPRQLGYDEVHDQLIAEVRTAALVSAQEKARSLAYPDPSTIDLQALGEILKEVRGK